MSSRFCRIMMIGLMFSSFISFTFLTTRATAERLVSRIELHPIQTITLSSEFRTGEKHGSSDTIACELRIPSGSKDQKLGSCSG
jgi:hypothetical protein